MKFGLSISKLSAAAPPRQVEVVPRRHFLRNLKYQYFRKEKAVELKPSWPIGITMFVMLKVLFSSFINSFALQSQNKFFHTGAAASLRRHSVFGRSAKIATQEQEKHFFDEPLEFYIN